MTGLVEHLLSAPSWLVLLLVFGLPALESSVFLGFIFPGEMAVLFGGVVASQGRLPLVAVLIAAIAGAIAGDTIGYLVGRRWGRRVLDSTLGRFVNARHLDRAERALGTRGGLAVFIGRFTVALRVVVPGLAGMGHLPYRTFAIFNVAGAVVWGAIMVTAGYLAGSQWHTVQHVASGVGIAITVVVVALLVGARLLRHRRDRKHYGEQVNTSDLAATTTDGGQGR